MQVGVATGLDRNVLKIEHGVIMGASEVLVDVQRSAKIGRCNCVKERYWSGVENAGTSVSGMYRGGCMNGDGVTGGMAVGAYWSAFVTLARRRDWASMN